MAKVTQTSSRKSEHIRINLEENVDSAITTGLDNYHFAHEALPEFDLEEVDLKVSLFGRALNVPLLISGMTGGTEEAREINHKLAAAAQEVGIAMGVGSQRAAIEDASLEATFQVRALAPDVLLLANLGAVQLNYGYGVDECKRAVDMIEADALVLHLNSLQEAVQVEGDTRFGGLLDKIKQVCLALDVPVIAKEVGWGFSEETARRLEEVGIAAIDVAGAGGTSWSQVEMYRAKTESQARLAGAFIGWGIPTSDSIQLVRIGAPNIKVFASGGLRNGVDIAKSIALGATLGGMASPYLKAATESEDMVVQTIHEIARELQVCMFAAGAADVESLMRTNLLRK
ncbi:MAG: type 2 isopentenyl-diphosphate Delta-isomerase [Chloroflexi bacterium]|nr:type 2 isopentenyl-diphosphate Delta-isomerase [Chloroflexota bacterium]